MVKRYEYQHQIDTLAIGDLANIHIPREGQFGTDDRSLYYLVSLVLRKISVLSNI